MSATPQKRKLADKTESTQRVLARFSQVECPCCHDIMHSPVTIGCVCNIAMCQACVRRLSSTDCPLCKTPRSQNRPCSRQFSELLDMLVRRCCNVDCRHRPSTYDEIQKHESECKFGLIKCPNIACDQQVQRLSLSAHIVTCRFARCTQFVGERKSTTFGCSFMGTQREIKGEGGSNPLK